MHYHISSVYYNKHTLIWYSYEYVFKYNYHITSIYGTLYSVVQRSHEQSVLYSICCVTIYTPSKYHTVQQKQTHAKIFYLTT